MAVSDGEVVQAVVDYVSGSGVHFQNKFSYLAQFASDQSEAVVLAAIASHLQQIMDNLVVELNGAFNDPDTYMDVIEFIDGAWEVVRNVGTTFVNTSFNNSSNTLPFQTSAYLVGRTARPRSRGRKFLPPFGEDQQASSLLESTALADVVDAAADYIDDIDLGGGNGLVPGVPSTVTGTFLPFVGATTNSAIGTQRRRRPGVGI